MGCAGILRPDCRSLAQGVVPYMAPPASVWSRAVGGQLAEGLGEGASGGGDGRERKLAGIQRKGRQGKGMGEITVIALKPDDPITKGHIFFLNPKIKEPPVQFSCSKSTTLA